MFKLTRKKILLAILILFAAGTLCATALVAYMVIYHNQPLALPAPTGTYAVGRSEFDWVDAGRVDPLSTKAGEKRELAVWVWYPSAAAQADQAAPYLPPAWVQAREQDHGIGQYIESNFSNIITHSTVNAPLAQSQSAYPVIIMQPGMGPLPTDYTVFAEDLASHGYVVFGIAQTNSSNVVVFPDGRVVLRSVAGISPDSADAAAADQNANRIGKVWAQDALFVTDKVAGLNADPAGFFHNHLDLAHIGYFGHSFGGATAVHVCELDARCQAAADLDGTLFSDQASGIPMQPVLFMAEDACGSNCTSMHQAYANAKSAAYYLTIRNTQHFNYSDLPLRLSPLARVLYRGLGVIGAIQPERGLEIANAYLVAFFDQALKGMNSDLLQKASVYPEAQLEKH